MPQNNKQKKTVIILGAGPAGITAAVELAKHNIFSTLIERESQPGGLARTVCHNGYRFDIGGHRFYTKHPDIQTWWENMLGEDFLLRHRKSQILYKGCHLEYPLHLGNLFRELGVLYLSRAFISYLKARLFPRKPEVSFEDWVVNHFGRMLYQSFFKSYTEKVWGIPCSELSATWASQRIKGLSFFSVVYALLNQKKQRSIKSLITAFHYPRLGPGQMWEVALSRTDTAAVAYSQTVSRIAWEENRITAVHATDEKGAPSIYQGTDYLSSIAMQDFIKAMGKTVPEPVQQAANRLNYRDFILVALMLDIRHINSDNWLYIHDERVQVGRIQNFGNWSPDLIPDDSTSCLGFEYFCNKGEGLWLLDEAEIIAVAKKELAILGLANNAAVIDAKVVRVEQAYPVYNADHQQHVDCVKQFLGQFGNLQLIGRNGMHKYNNQDHAMLSAMLAARNITGEKHDVWSVNTSPEYGEEMAKA